MKEVFVLQMNPGHPVPCLAVCFDARRRSDANNLSTIVQSISANMCDADELVLCLKQTPFTLTLRLWDIYILEGERVLTAMAYTILKLHKSKVLAECVSYGRSGSMLGHPCAVDTESLAGHYEPACCLVLATKRGSPMMRLWGRNEMTQGLKCCAWCTANPS